MSNIGVGMTMMTCGTIAPIVMEVKIKKHYYEFNIALRSKQSFGQHVCSIILVDVCAWKLFNSIHYRKVWIQEMCKKYLQ